MDKHVFPVPVNCDGIGLDSFKAVCVFFIVLLTTFSGFAHPPFTNLQRSNELKVDTNNQLQDWISYLIPKAFDIPQTITFTPIEDKCPDAPDFLVQAESDAGLPLTFSVVENVDFVEINIVNDDPIVSIIEANIDPSDLPAVITILADQPGDATHDPAQATETFTIFPDESDFNFFTNGTAQQVECTDCYVLTPDAEDAAATIWSDFKLDLTQSFRLELTVNLGSNDAMGGDGFTFALNDDPEGTAFLGSLGTPMAVDGMVPSFGVEFDTWQSTGTTDPVEDHLSFWSGGDVTTRLQPEVQAKQDAINIEDGTDYPVVIEWDPATNKVFVEFDGVLRDVYDGDIRPFFSPSTTAYFGFGAGTGGATNEHRVCIDNLIQGGPILNIATSTDDENCDLSNGSTTVTISGGTPSYSVIWRDDQGATVGSTETATGLSAGTYSVEVTDGNSITKTAFVVLENIPGPTLETSSQPADCNVPNGSATVTATASPGGSTSFSYSWSDSNDQPVTDPTPETPESVEDIAAGTYSVTVTDTDGCEETASITVEAIPPYTLDFNSTEVSFCGAEDGTAMVTPNPAGNYTYLWDDPGAQTTAMLSGLAAGTYSVTVTNQDNGCVAVGSVAVGANCPALTPAGTATPDGGNCYTLTTPAPDNQAAAIWAPDVINLNNEFIIEAEVYFGEDFSPDNRDGADGIAFTLHQNGRGTAALGGYGGSYGISIENGTEAVAPSFGVEFDTYPNGGEPAFDHLSFFGNSDVYTPLQTPVQASAGSPNIEDAAFHKIRIEWDPSLTVPEMKVFFDDVLRDTYSGDILTNEFGGTPEVYWGFGGGTGGATNLQQLCLTGVFIDSPLDIQTTVQPENCKQGDGQVTVEVIAGGTEPYTFYWSNDPGTPEPTGIRSDLSAGTYFVTVIDAANNTGTLTFTVTETGCEGLIVNENAVYEGGDCYTLTPEAETQKGTAWSPTKINLTENFVLTTSMNFGDNEPGGDGIAFALQDDIRGTAAIGDIGGSFGIDDQAGGTVVAPSFGVVFKTYPSTEDDRVYFFRDGSTTPVTAVVGPDCATGEDCGDIEDGMTYEVIIEWDANQQIMTTFFGGILVSQYDGRVLEDVTSILSNTEAHWGFGAGTGSAINRHQVCIESMVRNGQVSQFVDFPQIISACTDDGTVQLNATSTSGLDVEYTIIEGGDLVEFVQGSPGLLNLLGGAGQVTIEATQPGNANYKAATPVQMTFTIEEATGIGFNTYGAALPDPDNCDCYIVTPDELNQAGAVWSQNTLDLTHGFVFETQIMMSEDLSADNRDRADGITFAIQNTDPTYVGSIGTDMAVDGLTHSFGFELDNYAGTMDVFDPDTNPGGFDLEEDHVAFWAGGDVTSPLTGGPVLVDETEPNFEDGEFHSVVIEWNPNTQTMSGSFDGVEVLTFTAASDLVVEYLNNNPVVNFGFAGGTGGKTSLQKFCVIDLRICRDVTLDLTAMLQGAFDPDAGTMQDLLRTTLDENNEPLLPKTSPYDLETSVPAIPADVVDWVLVEIRNPDDPSVVEASKSCFITTAGQIVDVDGVSNVTFQHICFAEAYIAVKHRNHLGVMTADPVALPLSSN